MPGNRSQRVTAASDQHGHGQQSIVSDWPDHFSVTAVEYERYRPTYPPELFAFVAQRSRRRDVVWDCATGSGQAARGLAGYYRKVVGTDASVAQLASARGSMRVRYAAAQAHAAPLASRSADLVAVAQAAHWFVGDDFYGEVRRVARPHANIAMWTYSTLQVDADIRPVVSQFLASVAAHWPAERRFVEAGYRTLAFPFEAQSVPSFMMRSSWTLQQLLGYVTTWSAVRQTVVRTGHDPVPMLARQLRANWGSASTREIRWPIHLLFASVHAT